MSFPPVTGVEVPETANGLLKPVASENGPHAPALVKCRLDSRPCPGEGYEDRDLGNAENNVDDESCSEPELYGNERTSSLSSHASQVTDTCPPSETCTGTSESESKYFDIPEASYAFEHPGAAPLWDSAHQAHYKDSSQPGGPVDTYRQQTEDDEVEEEDGEKEKQDEEDDEKNEKKWIHQCAGGRTEVQLSGL